MRSRPAIVAAVLVIACAGAGLWLSGRGEHAPDAGSTRVAATAPAPDTPRTDAAARAVAPVPAPEAAIPAEAMFLRGDALDGDAAMRILQGNAFDALLARMRRESDAAGIAAAADFGTQLRETIEVARQGDRLQDIACGRHVCVVAMDANGGDGQSIADVSQSLAEQNPGRVNSLVVARASDPARPNAYRLLFSTDPATHSIQVPASP